MVVFKGGYNNRIAFVDLSRGSVEYNSVNEDLAFKFIGGRGYGGKRLFDTSLQTDALSSQSLIGLYAGPVTGTGVPLANRLTLVFRSPLTRTIAYANTGGYVATALKLAGLDALELTGSSDSPKYLFVKNGAVSLEDASALWGKGATECLNYLRAKHGDVRILSIGVAGEKLVKYANVVNDAGRSSGVRHGAGAVLGQKRVKAVVIAADYSRRLPVSDRQRFMDLFRRLTQKVKESPLLNRVNGLFSVYGTPLAVGPLNEFEAIPYKNYTATSFEHANQLNSETMSGSILISRLTCNSCSVQCRRETASLKKYKFRVEGPDYAQISSLGSNCGVEDLESVAYMNYLCYEVGLDPIETGNILAVLASATEKGYLAVDDGLRWGDVDRMVHLIKLISERKEMGEKLAVGANYLAEAFKDTSLSTAVKGITIQNADPRVEHAWGLLNATENTGASLHIWVYPDLIYSFASLPGIKSLVSESDDFTKKASAVKYKQDLVAVLDSLQICAFSNMAYNLADYVEALNTVVGWGFNEEDFLRTGERIFNLERRYNNLIGIEEDALPPRFIAEPVPYGKHKGQLCPLDSMLESYYRLRGWSSRGVIEDNKLRELLLID
jgi:aldehyde:ferredoxin oxidoreductase